MYVISLTLSILPSSIYKVVPNLPSLPIWGLFFCRFYWGLAISERPLKSSDLGWDLGWFMCMRHDGTTEFRKGLRNKKKIRYSPRTAFLFPLVQLLQRRKSMRQENAYEKFDEKSVGEEEGGVEEPRELSALWGFLNLYKTKNPLLYVAPKCHKLMMHLTSYNSYPNTIYAPCLKKKREAYASIDFNIYPTLPTS
nr:hypothetical protein Q903MT_gene2955 [Picea sitchensis]